MTSSIHRSFIFLILWLSHMMIDFMVGVWAVYKTIASIDILIAGLMASCASFIGEGSQLYFGSLCDKGHYHKLAILGLLLTITATFFSYFDHYFFLFMCLLSIMVGSGAFHPAGIKIIVAASEKKKNLLIAFFASGGMIGAALSQFVFVKVHHEFNGHTLIFLVPLVILACLCSLAKFPKIEPHVERLSLKKSIKLLKPYRYELGLLYFVGVCLQAMVLSFSFLLPEVLQIKGYESWFCLGGGYFYFILGAALASLPTGYFIDRFGYKASALVITIFGGVCLNLLLSLESLSLIPIIMLLILLGSTLGVTVPVVVAGSNSIVPSKFSGLVSGIFIGGVSCLAGLSPFLSGLLTSYVTNGSAILTLELMSFLSLFSLGAIYLLPNPKTLPITIVE